MPGNIQELMHSFMGKGKIGTSTPPNAKAAQRQAIAIAERKAGNPPPARPATSSVPKEVKKPY